MELEVPGRVYTSKQGCLPVLLGLEKLRKCPVHPKVCYCFLAAHMAQLLTESHMVCKLGDLGSQRVTKACRVVFTRVMQIQIWQLQGSLNSNDSTHLLVV